MTKEELNNTIESTHIDPVGVAVGLSTIPVGNSIINGLVQTAVNTSGAGIFFRIGLSVVKVGMTGHFFIAGYEWGCEMHKGVNAIVKTAKDVVDDRLKEETATTATYVFTDE